MVSQASTPGKSSMRRGNCWLTSQAISHGTPALSDATAASSSTSKGTFRNFTGTPPAMVSEKRRW